MSTPEQLAVFVRLDRNRMLTECDWTQIPDAPLDAAAREAWAQYRQALRDLPQQPGFPAVTWPQKPL